MINVKQANTILYCRKWQETVQFYEQILGLTVNFSNEWFVEFVLNDSARLSVANAARATIQSGDGLGITVALQVEDTQRLRTKLLAAGVTATPIKKRWGAAVFYVTDPEGNRLEFWS